MDRDRIEGAVRRIEAANARIHAAAQDPRSAPPDASRDASSASDPTTAEMRAAVTDALRDLDTLIESLEG